MTTRTATTRMATKKKVLLVRVEPALHRTVKTYTASAGISMETFIRGAVITALERANDPQRRE